MPELPMKSTAACDHNSILQLNRTTQDIKSSQNILSLNMGHTAGARKPSREHPPLRPLSGASAEASMPHRQPQPSAAPAMQGFMVPQLFHPLRKGQKVVLDSVGSAGKIRVCLGWNTDHPLCDIDVSAFILGSGNKVLGDDWFVFYGQPDSPDRSIHFSPNGDPDRQYISVDLNALDMRAQKIVFVLTINEAAANNLNFSMVRDAYARIFKEDSKEELVSFRMTDYYANVISMMICEIYLHNENWKCTAVGNGVARDLAGLCALYGVALI